MDVKPVARVVIQMLQEISGDQLVWNEYRLSSPAYQNSKMGPPTQSAQAQHQPQMSSYERPSLQQRNSRIRTEPNLPRRQ